jgi:hypothetical protein
MTLELTTAEAAQAFADAVATVRASYEAYVEAGFTDSTLSVWRSACNVAEAAFITFAFADEGNVARIAVFEVEKELAEFPNHYRFEPKRLMFDEDITSGVNEHVLFSGIIASFATLYVIHRNRNIA